MPRVRSILRLSLVMAVLFSVTHAWFGSDDKKKSRSRRSRETQDYVETEQDVYQEDGDYQAMNVDQEEPPKKSSRRGSKNRRDKSRDRAAKAKDRDQLLDQDFSEQVLHDETIEESYSPEDDDGYLDDASINKLWAEHMHDFVPEDMTNVIVENKSTEALFENIGHQTPTTVKGAYYVLGGNTEKTISCLVYDPNREIVYKRNGSAQGLLIFNTTVAGEYAIIFSNMNSGEDITVTLALHTYEQKEEEIQFDIDEYGKRFEVKADGSGSSAAADGGSAIHEDDQAASEKEISTVRAILREIQVQIKQMQNETKLSMMRQDGHNEDLLENLDWNFYFMLVEVACFIAIVSFQLHHIKKMLDNKLII